MSCKMPSESYQEYLNRIRAIAVSAKITQA